MEILIGIVIIGLCGLLAYEKYEHKRTLEKMTNALISKTAKDLKELETIDKLKVTVTPPVQQDLVPMGDLTEEEYDEKIIGKEIA